MKLQALMTGIALTALTSGVMAAEPTRGFLFEHGHVAAPGTASVDLSKGVASARLGLVGSELILTTGEAESIAEGVGSGPSTTGTYKIGFGDGFAGYIGIGYTNVKQPEKNDYFNFKIGVAYTLGGEPASLSVTPEFVIDDHKGDEYFNVGVGAHFGIAKMSANSYLNIGVEVLVTTKKHTDTIVDIGLRWVHNDRFTVDLIPVSWGHVKHVGNEDAFGIPGQLRFNAVF